MTKADNQHWDPRQYAQHAGFVPQLGMEVLELLAPKAGEYILDLGCGDGVLSTRLLEAGCRVLAVDASPEMVAAANARGLDAHVCDGESLEFNRQFDAVFSNAALHWMRDPQRVIGGVWRSLKPGGRFVAEFGAKGNVSGIVTALESVLAEHGIEASSPWYFPEPQDYRALLAACGFDVTRLEAFERPTLLPGDVGSWLETFAQAYFTNVSAKEKNEVVNEVVTKLSPHMRDNQGRWFADYVRIRFSASKPE